MDQFTSRIQGDEFDQFIDLLVLTSTTFFHVLVFHYVEVCASLDHKVWGFAFSA